MKVEGAARRRPAEDDPGRRYPIREPAMHGLVLGDDQVLEVRALVVPCVDAGDLHWLERRSAITMR